MQNSLSVHELVEFSLPPRDLVMGAPTVSRLTDGSRAHRKYQAEAGEDYQSEVFFAYDYEGEVPLHISGRADGVIESGNVTQIEELKSTLSPLETLSPNPQHLAQLHCYGAMYCLQNGVSSVCLRLVYLQLDSKEQKAFEEIGSAADLIGEFLSYCQNYACAMAERFDHMVSRNEALSSLAFPFPEFRMGQREMAAAVFRSIRDQSLLMLEAPTGIGKTMAALFPALKALSQGYGERIFYLSARGTVQKSAEDTLQLLLPSDFPLLCVTITAKEKCCPCPECACHPLSCPLAAGFYERLPKALEEAEKIGLCTKEQLEKLASKYNLCPFEMTLDIASIADVVICDYNYAFDPRVHLHRFFDEKSDSVLLVDEAHNLVDRARECYSAAISWEDVMALRRVLPKGKPKGALGELKQTVTNLQEWFVALRKQIQADAASLPANTPPKELGDLLRRFVSCAEPFLNGEFEFTPELFPLFFTARNYLTAAGAFDENFRVLYRTYGNDASVRLYCLCPAEKLKKSYGMCRSGVFFSATLSPEGYFRRLLGLNDAAFYAFPSPFDPKNLKVMILPDISTAYKNREETLENLCQKLYEAFKARPGRYAVFFPSHSYLQKAHECFASRYPEVDAPCQQTHMTQEERQAFLNRFEEERPMLAFAVMGGIFSEGIDLTGERLEGAMIVGVGLPQPDAEQEALKAYFDQEGLDGFLHAYLYPGWIRVLQAAGRVIRTPKDKGVVLLIDPRFQHSRYTKLFPAHWEKPVVIRSDEQLKGELEAFWSRCME